MDIFIPHDALERIRAAASGSEHETGGLVLGYRHRLTMYMVAVTVAESDSAYSFDLDGEAHQKLAAEAIKAAENPFLEVLGVWHSHLFAELSYFTTQDETANSSIAAALHGAVSILYCAETNEIVKAVYYDVHGETESCSVFIT